MLTLVSKQLLSALRIKRTVEKMTSTRQFPLVFHEGYEFDIGAHVFPTRKFRLVRDRLLEDGTIVEADVIKPDPAKMEGTDYSDEDFVVHAVMTVNSTVDGAFVASSGKNMGAFKGVGFPEELGHYYKLDKYEGHTWVGHNRFRQLRFFQRFFMCSEY